MKENEGKAGGLLDRAIGYGIDPDNLYIGGSVDDARVYIVIGYASNGAEQYEFASDISIYKWSRDLWGEDTLRHAEVGMGAIGAHDATTARRRAAFYLLAADIATVLDGGATFEELAGLLGRKAAPRVSGSSIILPLSAGR